MQTYSRQVKNGTDFDHYFPRARLTDTTIQKDADLSATMKFIPQVVRKTLWQTKKIAQLLEGVSLEDTCKNVFDFTYDHISYKKDDDGFEQIRSPARAWHDRKRGIDCDCYSVFIASILTNLGIPVTLRVAKYKEENGFQHIYPIVPLPGGKYITMDPVVHTYNHEQKPILEKIDQKMNLNFLDGVNDDEEDFDSTDYYDDDPIYGLGKGISLKKIGQGIKKVAKKISIKNVLNVVNKLNPATVLMRNGVLACMKLNLFKVAGKLRYAYLTDAQAQQKGILMDKFAKLKSVKTKLEDIFFKAGGKPDNLKKAILNGKGNRDHSVSGIDGLGYVDDYELAGFDEDTPLETLLGDMYYSENEGIEGLGQLGDPATASAIAAASGAVGALAAIIKGIGSLFPKGKAPANEDGEEGNSNETVQFNDDGSVPESGDSSPAAPSVLKSLNPLINRASPFLKRGGSLVNKLSPLLNKAKGAVMPTNSPGIPKNMDVPTDDDEPAAPQTSMLQTPSAPKPSSAMIVAPSAAIAPVEDAAPPGTLEPATPSTVPGATTPAATEGFWDKNKKWLKPTAIGVGVLGAVIAGVVIMKNSKPPAAKLSGVDGTPKKVTRKRRKAPAKTKKSNSRAAPRRRKAPVALM